MTAPHSAALALIEAELAALTKGYPADDSPVPREEVFRVLTVAKAQREMIDLGIHTKQMEQEQ